MAWWLGRFAYCNTILSAKKFNYFLKKNVIQMNYITFYTSLSIESNILVLILTSSISSLFLNFSNKFFFN